MRTKIGIITLLIAGLMLLTAGLVSAQEHNIVSGTVTDNSDLPIEGASVEVDGTDPLISAVTDPSGKYTLEGVAGGNQTFLVSADGYDGQTVIAEVSETAETTLDFSLQPTVEATEPNSVTGTVTDATNGKPIEDASVQVDDADPPLSANTDEFGEYMLGGVTAGGKEFTASAEDYESETVGSQVSDTEGITVNFTLTPLVQKVEASKLDSDGDDGKAAGDRKGYVGVFATATSGATGSGVRAFILTTKKGDIEIQIPDDGLESITKRPGRSPGVPKEGDRVAVLVEFSAELDQIARQIIVKPKPKPPIVGAVTSITTDENGVRTLTIMRPNGTTKRVRLGSKGPPPEVGDLITAFQGRGGDDDDDDDGDGPPIIRGLVRSQEVRQRLEGFLQDLSDRAADALEKVEERLADRLAKLAEKLESHASKHAKIIERISQNDKLPPQAVAGMLNGLERAQQGYDNAKIKATEARSKSGPSRGPGLKVDRGNSGRGNRGEQGGSDSGDQEGEDNNGSSDDGSRGNSGSSGKGNRGNGRSGGGGLDSSGSGSGGDEDNSGSGNGGDEDNSGSGSGKDEDNSGSGS